MRIHILDPLIANQIAAGEVIERPASIVKELLENSLDAKATEIIIDIEKGGTQLIRIKDNGTGIYKEDLPLAVQRHGTSKIQKIQDLTAINSLGFRGEALASICAISRFKISSCAKGQADAYQLWAEGTDTELLEKPVAHLPGTTIEVRDLFFNTPVRRKFLRTEKTEFFHIEEICKRVAIANFELRLELNHNGRNIFKLLPAKTDILQEKRIKKLCVKGFTEHALKIDNEATGLRLWGWIAVSAFSRAQNDMQYLYINGRMVRDKLVNHAIRRAYQQLNVNRYAAYILFLECDPAIVDVNVHPTKHEVRFRESRLIHDFIYSSLKNALAKTDIITESLERPDIKTYAREFNPSRYKIAESMENYAILASSDSQNDIAVLEQTKKIGKLLTCLQQKFLIIENEPELMIVDIYRLRTVILKQSFLASTLIATQPLLFPLNITLANQQIASFEQCNAILTELGFDISVIGINQVMLRTAPRALYEVDFAEFIPELFDKLLQKKENKNYIDVIAHLAPRFISIFLDPEQQKQLVQQVPELSQVDLNYCCVYLSIDDVAKLFHE